MKKTALMLALLGGFATVAAHAAPSTDNSAPSDSAMPNESAAPSSDTMPNESAASNGAEMAPDASGDVAIEDETKKKK